MYKSNVRLQFGESDTSRSAGDISRYSLVITFSGSETIGLPRSVKIGGQINLRCPSYLLFFVKQAALGLFEQHPELSDNPYFQREQ